MPPGFARVTPAILQLSRCTLQAASTLKPWATTTVDLISLCKTTASPCRLTVQGISLMGS